ncbi:MAG: translational GTPase TypA [Acutalibacteraceae bacterium]|nr:translational GTPase TypA [Acutalibacteraceae bacterium]
MSKIENLRNVAIIAHVDHGKTTLVDQLLKQSGTFRVNENVNDRVMDSNDLERERGITILSKNTSVMYGDIKINIVDTPGHADFGGEVERILQMVDGVLLLVDAFEGCMPQTRFVLKKALALGKKAVVVVNKIDRPMARPHEVVDEVLDLFIELGADEDQIEFPVIFASGRDGYATYSPDVAGTDMKPLFDAIVKEIDPPEGDTDGPLQILFTNIEYDDYLGRIGVGRVIRGNVKAGQTVALCHKDGTSTNVKIAKLFMYQGLKRMESEAATVGDIIQVAGISELEIGETACAVDNIEALPFVKIDEPTLAMNFMVNNSPFAGKDGKFVTSRNLRDRLFKEVMTNVSLRVEETDSADTFKVSGRGELHLSILIETMRRQGYEFQVSPPEVIYKRDENGTLLEPIELLMIEVPEEYVGNVMERLGNRKAEIKNMGTREGGTSHLEFLIPARGLLGYRSQFMTDTNGNGIMNHVFDSYQEYKGDIDQRSTGSIIAHEQGEATGYGLFNTQSRGRLFIGPGVPVYEGMIVGENPKSEDIVCNVCKKKQMTNTRASGSDDALRLVPPSKLSLEQSLEFIKNDELVEITPNNIRLRKRILNKEERMKAESKKK